MFDRISPVYDRMNRGMTLGLDQRWRTLAADAVVRPGDRVLDACCGTGDLALACERAGGAVTGLDFSEKMLERARAKSSTIEWRQGDALAMPFDDATFDAASVGFGVRNLDDLPRGLAELRRVLRPGRASGLSRDHETCGCAATVLPRLVRRYRADGGEGAPWRTRLHLSSGERRRFPGPKELAALLEEAGFSEVGWRRLGGGIVALHTAASPD